MPSSLAPHALTTAARVKERLTISVTTWDTLFEHLINSATDFIERMSGGRRFLETTYTQEVYHGGDGYQKAIVLRNFPVTSLTAAQYRAGVPGTPAWTDFDASQYELIADKEPRRVRIYSFAPAGQNNLRFTYVAGYKIAFASETTPASHTLPFDVSDLCERLVVWHWKMREAEGKTSETGTEAQVNWRQGLTDDDKELLRRLTAVVFS